MGGAWQHRANNIGFAVLLLIVVLTPLPFGSNRPFFWFLFSVVLGLLLLLWAGSALASREATHNIVQVSFANFRVEAGLAVILGMWILFQAMPFAPEGWQHPVWATAEPLVSGTVATISAAPEATIDGWVRFMAYGATFFLAMQYGRNSRRARQGLWAVAVAGVAYGLYGLIVQFGGYDSILWYQRWDYHDSLTSTFINRNSYATYGGMTLICCISLLTGMERRLEIVAAREGKSAYVDRLATYALPLVVGVIVIMTAILLSQSRAGLLATALGFMAFYFCRRRRRRQEMRRKAERERRSQLREGEDRRRRDRRGWRGIAPLALAGLMLIVSIISGAATWTRFDQDAVGDAGGRLAIYTATLSAIGDRPWLGHGLGSYRTVFESYRSPALFKANVIDKAHNSYLDFAFEAGIPAFLMLLFLFGRIFYRCLLGIRRRQRDSVYSAVAVAAVVILAVHSLIDFSLQIPAVTILFMFLLGIGFSQSWSSRTAQ